MTDIFLYQGEVSPNDIKLRDPTTPSGVAVGEDSWHQRFTDPVTNFAVRLRAAAFIALISTGAVISPWALTQPEQVNESNWHQAWSDPARGQGRLAAQQSGRTDPLVVSTPETVTVDKWYSPFGEVTRAKGLKPQLQSSSIIDPWSLTQKETVTEDRWHQPLSEPSTNWADYRLNRYQIAQIASGMAPGGQGATIAPEVVTLDKWYASLSEWPRQPKGLSSPYQQAYTVSPWALTQAETTSADRWYVELSQPFRRPSPIGRYPSIFDAIQFGSTPVVVNCDSWYNALSQPLRKPLYTSLIGAQSWPPWQGPLLEWYGDLSQPARRPLQRQQYQTDTPFLQTIYPGSWHTALSEPVRVKRRPEGGLFSIVNTSIGPAPVSIVTAIQLKASKFTVSLLGSKPVTILLGSKTTINLKGEVKK